MSQERKTGLMLFMEYLRLNNYYISTKMVDKYWELIKWERENTAQRDSEDIANNISV